MGFGDLILRDSQAVQEHVVSASMIGLRADRGRRPRKLSVPKAKQGGHVSVAKHGSCSKGRRSCDDSSCSMRRLRTRAL